MNSKEIKWQADQKRDEAKEIIGSLLAKPYSSLVDKLVDSIIECAILEISAIQKQAVETLTDK